MRPVVLEGVRRLAAYQSDDYAQLYLDRLRTIATADANADAQGKLLNEVARHLAVRMSYEDVVRVAQAKIAPARLQRIARDELRVKDEPFSVHDFLKPGIEELTQLLPPALARPIRRIADRKGWTGRVYFGMEIDTTSVERLFALPRRWRSSGACGLTASATRTNRRRSNPGSRTSPKPQRSRASLRCRSPNAHG